MKRKGYTITVDLLGEIERKFPQLAGSDQPEDDVLGLVIEMNGRFSLRRITKDIARQSGPGITMAIVTAPLRSGRQVAILPVDQLLNFAEQYSDMKDDLQVERMVKAAAGL
jgi:hypothetical protein